MQCRQLDVVSRRIGIVAIAGVLIVTVPACTQKAGSSPEAGDSWTVSTPAAIPGANLVSHGWTVQLAEPADHGELAIGSDVARATPAKQALNGLSRYSIQAGEPVEITLSNGTIPTLGVTISRTLEVAVPADAEAALSYYDERHEAWTSVATLISPDRRTLSATVHHLSFWDDVVYKGASVISKRLEKPACEKPTPRWVADTVFLDDQNAPVRWCAGHDPAHPELLVVKVAINRPYGAAIVPATKPVWAWDSLFSAGPEDLLTNLLARTMDLPKAVEAGFGNRLLLPGGQEADFGFNEEQVRKLGTKPLVSVDANVTFAVAGLTFSALSDELGSGQGPIAIAATLVSLAQCQHDLEAISRKTFWSDLAGAALGCLGSHADDVARDSATVLVKLYPQRNPKDLGAIAGKAAGKLWLIWALGKVFQISEWGADMKLNPAAWNLTVFTIAKPKPPEPTLGKVWASSQEGYGTPHPATIFNGGDPTGLVTGVHWRSWGGEKAIGDGISIDDSTSPSVAEAPQAKATVVAFDLGTCQGKLMYRAINWYFPERGGSFNPRVYINICTGEYVS